MKTIFDRIKQNTENYLEYNNYPQVIKAWDVHCLKLNYYTSTLIKKVMTLNNYDFDYNKNIFIKKIK